MGGVKALWIKDGLKQGVGSGGGAKSVLNGQWPLWWLKGACGQGPGAKSQEQEAKGLDQV